MKILLPIDDAHYARAIEEFLLRFDFGQNTEMEIFHVIQPAEAIASCPSEQYRLAAGRLCDEVLARFRSRFPSATITAKMAEGNPKILDESVSWGADLIAMGSHSRGRLEQLLLGSVSSAVSKYAHCTVAIVRLPSGKTTNAPATAATGSIAD